MDLRPGALLGLPPGAPSVVFDPGYWRDLLVLVALAAGWSTARGREGRALAIAIAWALLAVGFWIAALGRPYGLLQDPATTRWAADVSVAAHAGGGGGFLAGEPAGDGAWSARASRWLGAEPVLLAPTLGAAFVLPAIALVIALLWGRPGSGLAAILWMAASTLDPDVVRGIALVPALWPVPATGPAVAMGIAVLLAVGRCAIGPRVAAVTGVAVALSLSGAVGAHAAIGAADLPGVLLFDAIPWVALGVIGMRRIPDPAATALVAGGGAAVFLSAFGLGDAAVAAALYRAGLVLAATPVLVRGSERLAGRVANGAAWRGALVAVLLAGSFLTWWDPPRLDAMARASLESIPAGFADTMEWIRSNTDPGGVFVSGEDYAPAVAVLGGRRVLRAPTLLTAADEERRLRASRAVLAARRAFSLVERYGVRYVLLAPGQFRDHRLDEPWPVESGGATLRHRNASGVRVYELEP